MQHRVSVAANLAGWASGELYSRSYEVEFWSTLLPPESCCGFWDCSSSLRDPISQISTGVSKGIGKKGASIKEQQLFWQTIFVPFVFMCTKEHDLPLAAISSNGIKSCERVGKSCIQGDLRESAATISKTL